jgi:hypothetical protein
MNAISKALAVAVMVLGATAAVGCNRASDKDSEAVAPVESPATAPVVEESAKDGAKDDTATKTSTEKPGFEKNDFRFGVRFGAPSYGGRRYYAPHAPPAARYEYRGVAPSARHIWAPGYWHWSGREYTWIGGRWDVGRSGYAYVAPTWHRHHAARYEYIPGHWVRRN